MTSPVIFHFYIIYLFLVTFVLFFSHSFVSNSLQPYGLQHAWLPCPSLSPGVCSDSCPWSPGVSSDSCPWLDGWFHPTISSSLFCCPLLLLPSMFPSIRVFSNESALCIRWPTYWRFRFSTSPSNEYSGLISFRIDWFDLLVVQGTLQQSSPAPQFESINSSVLSFFYANSHICTWLLEKP